MKKAIIKVLSGEGSTSRTLRDEKGDINAPLDEHEKLFRVIEEIEHHSITPTTFNERVFEEDLDNWWYKDEYKTGGNHVVHFGINATSSRIISDTIPYNAGENLSAIITSGKIPVARVVSDSRSIPSSTSTSSKPPAIMLCVQEKQLLQKAVDYLLSSDEHYTVLLDILARERGPGDDYATAIMNERSLDVHTVVLYRNPVVSAESADPTSTDASASAARMQDVVLVIDPSNFAFSSHLSQFVSLNPAQQVAIIAPTHKTQIYKATGRVGPHPDEYRNCTDIAVKIAFGLNATYPMLVPQGIVTYTKGILENITACPVLQEVSNTKMDANILGDNLHVRMKQSSHPEIAKLFNDMARVVREMNDKIAYFVSPQQYKEILTRTVGILETTLDNSELIKLLSMHNAYCAGQMCTWINTKQEQSRALVELVGDMSLHDEMGAEL